MSQFLDRMLLLVDALPKNIEQSAYHNIDSMTKFEADYVEFQEYLQRSISSHGQHMHMQTCTELFGG